MTVNAFMKCKLDEIKNEVIQNISNDVFDSHEFIRNFKKKFEVEYVEFLNKYDDKPYRKVNSQIARFLSINKELLDIKDNRKIESPNVFGNETSNGKWIKQH